MSTARTEAPWTDEQAEAINRWQRSGMVHPLTCREPNYRWPLTATAEGLACDRCDDGVQQTSAPAAMLGEPPKPMIFQ